MTLIRYGGTSEEWTPAQLGSNLIFWHDASSDENTVSGGKYSQLTDLSANSNHYTQGTADNQPTQVTVNGLNAAQFDGSNDFMDTGAASDLDDWEDDVLHYYGVFRSDKASPDITGFNYFLFLRNDITSGGYVGIYVQNGSPDSLVMQARRSGATNTANIIVTPLDTNLYLFECQFAASNGPTSMRKNGTETDNDATSYTVTSPHVKTALGAEAQGTKHSFMTFCEDLVFAGTLPTAAEETNIKNYLNNRWSIY